MSNSAQSPPAAPISFKVLEMTLWLRHLAPAASLTSFLLPVLICSWYVQGAHTLPASHVPGTGINKRTGDLPGGTVGRNPPANGGDTGLTPGPRRFHMPH